MITGEDFYEVLSAMVPLYATMSLAYASVRFFRVFSPEQCAGINRFVAVFAIPFLSFKLIAFNNPYAINKKLILADTLQKVATLLALFLYKTLARRETLDWTITLNSLVTLPNTVVMGIPLLRAMYGAGAAELMVQIVVFQGLIWNTLLLVLCEFRAAKIFINEKFPGPHGGSNIVSLNVDSDVVSLVDGESLQTEVAEAEADGKLRVRILRRRSISDLGYATSVTDGVTPRLSNVTGVEIYSTRSSNSSQLEYGLGSVPSMGHLSLKESYNKSKMLRCSRSSGNSMNTSPLGFERNYSYHDHGDQIHMFVWNSSVRNSPVSMSNSLRNGVSLDLDHHVDIVSVSEEINRKDQSASIHGNGSKDIEAGNINGDGESNKKMPRASVVICLILTMVSRKLIRNPNTYAGLLGLLWSLVSFRWNIKMPIIIKGSITILSDTGLGLAMFSLGLFMALQPKIIACGKWMAVLAMAIRFLVGPAVMAAASVAIGIRGVLLQVAILQAALPQAIVSFVFAKEYNVHPQILSTSVTIGMVVALPVTVVYYILLGL